MPDETDVTAATSFSICDLEEGDVIEVETRNSIYKLKIKSWPAHFNYPHQRPTELIESVRGLRVGEKITVYGSTNGAQDRDRGELIRGRLLELFLSDRSTDHITSTIMHVTVNDELIF